MLKLSKIAPNARQKQASIDDELISKIQNADNTRQAKESLIEN